MKQGGAVLTGLAMLAILTGCGSDENSDLTSSDSTVALKLQLPNEPTDVRLSSVRIHISIPDGKSVYNEAFQKVPRGRENSSTGTTTYALQTIDLPGGTFYDIDAVVRACSESKRCVAGLFQIADCSAALDLGENGPKTFIIEMKSWDDPHCRFISS